MSADAAVRRSSNSRRAASRFSTPQRQNYGVLSTAPSLAPEQSTHEWVTATVASARSRGRVDTNDHCDYIPLGRWTLRRCPRRTRRESRRSGNSAVPVFRSFRLSNAGAARPRALPVPRGCEPVTSESIRGHRHPNRTTCDRSRRALWRAEDRSTRPDSKRTLRGMRMWLWIGYDFPDATPSRPGRPQSRAPPYRPRSERLLLAQSLHRRNPGGPSRREIGGQQDRSR